MTQDERQLLQSLSRHIQSRINLAANKNHPDETRYAWYDISNDLADGITQIIGRGREIL